MKAMILAAGLGTRLRPWTLEHPKALVPVEGVPMLERVIVRLKSEGFDDIIVNIHHFGDQIIDFLSSHDFGVRVSISDERGGLLDTGGGILKASEFFEGEPTLVHNVDILSDANLGGLMAEHVNAQNDVTLLTSDRDSTRRLMFDVAGNLRGWHNTVNGEYRPTGAAAESGLTEEAFSGIYIIGAGGVKALREYARRFDAPEQAFPVMDFLLSSIGSIRIRRFHSPCLHMLDIGKPSALQRAPELLKLLYR